MTRNLRVTEPEKCTSAPTREAPTSTKKDVVFWCIFLSISMSLFLSALDQTAIATALPTIASDLQASDFVWVGSAYALSSTAFLPMSGALAQIFGRRPTLMACLILFAIGSGVCGGARDMSMLISGRTVQGLGGGGLQALSMIILADIVTLQERGLYAGLFGLVWCIAGVAGPLIDLNLPVCRLAIACVMFFLRLPTPPGSLKEKLSRLDWIGNVLVISGTTMCTIALTWGGISAPWSSAQVLSLLILGIAVLAAFLAWEAIYATDPLVPFSLMSNRTSLSGYLQVFFVNTVAMAIIYYLPVYYQGCEDKSPTKSGLLMLSIFVIAPASIVAGVLVTRTQRYRPQMWAGWCLIIIGLGLFHTIQAGNSLGRAVGFSVVIGCGLGAQYSTAPFPVQAPLRVEDNARALSFLMFVRQFAAVWGVTIGGTVLQNELKRRIPGAFLAQFPQGAAIAYALIPQVPSLPEPLKGEVQRAFAGSLQVLWVVLLGIAAVGFLSSLLMRGLPLHGTLDEDWMVRAAGDEKERSLTGEVLEKEV